MPCVIPILCRRSDLGLTSLFGLSVALFRILTGKMLLPEQLSLFLEEFTLIGKGSKNENSRVVPPHPRENISINFC